MKIPGEEGALLTPAPHGWRLQHAGADREAASLGEVIVGLPAGAPLHLALPCQAALLERLTLPSKDREELSGMAQLQLEKTLPYPVEEVTSDMEIIHEGKEDSTVLTIAVHTPLLNELCGPLRDHQRFPQRVTLFARQVAAQAGPDAKAVLALWTEQGLLVAAIAEHGRLSWAQTVGPAEASTLEDDLPPLLLAAEMNGVPTEFERVLLAAGDETYTAPVEALFTCPIEIFHPGAPSPEGEGNLLPPDWEAAGTKHLRVERLRQRLLSAAVVYLLLVAAAFLYLAWTKHQVQVLDAQIAQIQPLIQATQTRQALWEALAPATDPSRTAVEIMFLVNRNRPSDNVKITVFDYAPAQFMVEGEAASAAEAIDFAERLRAEKELKGYKIEAGNPQILPNEHAQYRIFGRR